MADFENSNIPDKGWQELAAALADIQWQIDTGAAEAFAQPGDEPPAGEQDLSASLYPPEIYYVGPPLEDPQASPPDSDHLGGVA